VLADFPLRPGGAPLHGGSPPRRQADHGRRAVVAGAVAPAPTTSHAKLSRANTALLTHSGGASNAHARHSIILLSVDAIEDLAGFRAADGFGGQEVRSDGSSFTPDRPHSSFRSAWRCYGRVSVPMVTGTSHTFGALCWQRWTGRMDG
jgi:hypothetical protein